MNFVVLAVAEWEAAVAALWYDAQRPGLGEEFLAELGRTFERIQRASGACQVVDGISTRSNDVRRALLDRFAYLVIYLGGPDEVVVLAVAHTRRRPFYWLERLD